MINALWAILNYFLGTAGGWLSATWNFLKDLVVFLVAKLYDLVITIVQLLYDGARPILSPLLQYLQDCFGGPIELLTDSPFWADFNLYLGFANYYLPLEEFWNMTLCFFTVGAIAFGIRWVIKLIPTIG